MVYPSHILVSAKYDICIFLIKFTPCIFLFGKKLDKKKNDILHYFQVEPPILKPFSINLSKINKSIRIMLSIYQRFIKLFVFQ